MKLHLALIALALPLAASARGAANHNSVLVKRGTPSYYRGSVYDSNEHTTFVGFLKFTKTNDGGTMCFIPKKYTNGMRTNSETPWSAWWASNKIAEGRKPDENHCGHVHRSMAARIYGQMRKGWGPENMHLYYMNGKRPMNLTPWWEFCDPNETDTYADHYCVDG